MQDWERPPPKFVRKKKKTSKLIPYSIAYILIVLISFFLIIPIIIWLNFDSTLILIISITIFIIAILGGIILHVLVLSSFFQDKNF
jgi:uncharacterized Tic20 family protein